MSLYTDPEKIGTKIAVAHNDFRSKKLHEHKT